MNAGMTKVQWQGRSDRFRRIIAWLRREASASPKQLARQLSVCAKTVVQFWGDVVGPYSYTTTNANTTA